MKFLPWLVFLLSPVLPAPLIAQQNSGFSFTENDQGVLIREAGEKVLFYQRTPKSYDGAYTRAHYLHPLYDLDGKVLSEDFPSDHRHHRGVFWAWHQVWVGDQQAGDPWACHDFQWQVRSVKTRQRKDGTVELRARVYWKSPNILDASGDPHPLVDETAVIRIHPAEQNVRAIDISFRLRALVSDLRIGGSDDVKGYGGFSTRIVLPEDLRFVSQGGQVEPQTGQVEAGPWMDMVAPFHEEGSPSGLAILCHPTLPGYPQPWILRSSRSMQNAAWPGRDPVELSPDKPRAFNYRLVLHRGDTEAAAIAKRQAEFAAEKPRLAAGSR